MEEVYCGLFGDAAEVFAARTARGKTLNKNLSECKQSNLEQLEDNSCILHLFCLNVPVLVFVNL
jgi:hypothetical protein